ncbi:MAG: cytochrome D1 domain-containing protein [Thermoanaerobaculia bacterium]|nr:cytochrome D1 domain-containing protein [Thermoanaerobaculia bacterium]
MSHDGLARCTLPALFVGVLLASGPITADTLLVANKGEATLSFVDLESGEVVASVPTGAGPHEVAISPDGETAVVADYGGEAPGNSLTVVSVSRAEVLRTVDLGEHERPHGILFLKDGDRVVVTVEGSRAVAVVDIRSGAVEKVVETGQEVSHMVALHGSRAYVANIGSGTMTVLDLDKGSRLESVETGEGAEGITVTPDGSQIWVTNRGADTVSLVDPETLEVVKTLESEGFPIRAEVTPDGERVLVTNARSSVLTVIETATREVAKRVPIRIEAADPEDRLFGDRFGDSSVPIGIEIAPDGDRAFIAHANADRIQILDLESWETLGTITAGREPDGMAYSTVDVKEGRESG